MPSIEVPYFAKISVSNLSSLSPVSDPSVATTQLTTNQLGITAASTGCGSGGYWNRQDPAQLNLTSSCEPVKTDSRTVKCW